MSVADRPRACPMTVARRASLAPLTRRSRGSAMECAAHLDVMQVGELIGESDYALGIDLLERVVSMLTKLIDP